MRILTRHPRPRTGGAALMLSMLVLMVLVLIVWQIGLGTRTNMQVAKNDITGTTMDLAIESAMLQVFEQLKTDAEADAQAGAGGGGAAGGAAGGAGGLGALGGLGGLGGAAGGAGGDPAGAAADPPSDSRQDEWARPQRTEINETPLRILVQDENSKINVLGMLTADEGEAEKAFRRVVRVIDLYRQGTAEDVPTFEAENMAQVIRDTLRRRRESPLPRPKLITDDPTRQDLGMPMTLREFAGVEPFREELFRDYRDKDDKIVHSLCSYLTMVSSLETLEARTQRLGAPNGPNGAAGGAGGGGAGGAGGGSAVPGAGGGGSIAGGGTQGGATTLSAFGGTAGSSAGGPTLGANGGQAGGGGAGGPKTVLGAINLNTAPPVVLKCLFDDRDVPSKFWDQVIEFRNEEVEQQPGQEQQDPVLDEYGEEIIERKVFNSLDQLLELDAWYQMTPENQADVARMVGFSSEVFTVYVTARRGTGKGAQDSGYGLTRQDRLELDESGLNLTRTVRCTVWRRSADNETQVVPIERWEALDYWPYEILDSPDKDR